ncbi:aldo/keto reductase family domain-containing protein [Phthorimaea operculella]|nr:aldo/keto reductase family domain-containing protein [Phthorimaea operculella]
MWLTMETAGVRAGNLGGFTSLKENPRKVKVGLKCRVAQAFSISQRRAKKNPRAGCPEHVRLPPKNNKRQLRRMAAAAPQVDNFANIKFKLNNGHEMPAVGLGTFRIRRPDDIMKTVDYALDAGYRMFDTAAVYSNESYLKKAFQTLLPKYGLERSDIFVTTKLAPSNHGGPEVVIPAINKSLENLGLEHVDLYLVHFPGTSKLRAEDPRNKEIRAETWASMEEVYDQGLANAIGVSNFNVRHLQELLTNHCVVPAVNQVEWHPQYHQKELLQFCKEKDIVLQAYCSLGGTSISNLSLLENAVVQKIAQKHNKTSAQVLLMWALQHDVAVIPKSTDPQRIRENFLLDFRLSPEDLKALNDIGEKNPVKYAWDPNAVV